MVDPENTTLPHKHPPCSVLPPSLSILHLKIIHYPLAPQSTFDQGRTTRKVVPHASLAFFILLLFAMSDHSLAKGPENAGEGYIYDESNAQNFVPLDQVEKGRWERLWPTFACGAGLFSDGYLQGYVCAQAGETATPKDVSADR